MARVDFPVSMYQVTAAGRILKMEDAFEFSAALEAAFTALKLPLPTWRELTPEQFRRHVDAIREAVVERDEEGCDPAGSGPDARVDDNAG